MVAPDTSLCLSVLQFPSSEECNYLSTRQDARHHASTRELSFHFLNMSYREISVWVLFYNTSLYLREKQWNFFNHPHIKPELILPSPERENALLEQWCPTYPAAICRMSGVGPVHRPNPVHRAVLSGLQSSLHWVWKFDRRTRSGSISCHDLKNPRN